MLATISKKDALARTAEIKREVGATKKARIRILRLIATSVDRREYEIAGFETLAAWLEHVGIEGSVSHFRRQMFVIKKLAHLPSTTLEMMSEGNSYTLAHLPAKKLRDPKTIERAVELNPEAFKALVLPNGDGTPPEGWRTFSLRCPVGVYDRLQAAEAKIARILELDLSDEEKRTSMVITVWEAIATLIDLTPEERLKLEIEGGDAQATSAGSTK